MVVQDMVNCPGGDLTTALRHPAVRAPFMDPMRMKGLGMKFENVFKFWRNIVLSS